MLADPSGNRALSLGLGAGTLGRALLSATSKGVVMTDVTRRKFLRMAGIGAFGLAAPARADAPETFSPDEIVDTGHRFFGSISRGLAEAVQEAGRRWGLPNAYILGSGASASRRSAPRASSSFPSAPVLDGG